MGTTFVTIDSETGFWMRDSILELWLRLLALHIEESSDKNFIGRDIRDQWLLASKGCFGGHVPHDLETFAKAENGQQIIFTAVVSLMSELKKAPPKLDGVILNLLGMEGGAFVGAVESWRLLEVGEAFLGLLDGKITDTAASTDFMPGCRLLRE